MVQDRKKRKEECKSETETVEGKRKGMAGAKNPSKFHSLGRLADSSS